MNYKELIDYLEATAISVTGINTATADRLSAINDNNVNYARLLIMQATSNKDLRTKYSIHKFKFYLEDVYPNSERATKTEQEKFSELETYIEAFMQGITNDNIIKGSNLELIRHANWADNNVIAIEFTTDFKVKEC